MLKCFSDAMNGASDFVVEVFGEIGRHNRTAWEIKDAPANSEKLALVSCVKNA